jgi:hypothetical protein
MNTSENRRVQFVDDMPSIHEDFRKILCPAAANSLGWPSLARVHFPCFLRSGERQSSNSGSRCSPIREVPLDVLARWI